MRRIYCAIALVIGLFAAPRTSPAIGSSTAPSADDYRHIAGEVESSLQKDVLEKWFPAAVDRESGGFYENFKNDWTRGATGEKSIVYQSRLTWLAAQAARRYPDKAEQYVAITRHGVACLSDKLWDKEHGGLFWAVDDAGRPTPARGGEKHAYGIAFAMYAAAASHSVTHDPASLELAKKTFLWLDAHAHDAEHGGYYEALTAEGKPILAPVDGRISDEIGTHYGYKSMNTHIHLLEAITGLYAVWPDPLVKTRLQEVFEIVRDRIYVDPGCLSLYFNPDWRPVPDLDSFGHDIETAFLLTEAAEALGIPDDARTWSAARRLVDHALEVGFDHQHGGFYNEGTTFGRDVTKERIWWVQGEGLNALLLMHERYGRQTSKYWQAFTKEWDFIKTRQIDPKNGGWFNTVSEDGKPAARGKSDAWTEGYHQGRAMLNVSERLRKLAGPAEK